MKKQEIIKCPKCKTEFEKYNKWGDERKFCSRKCSNSRIQTKETKEKISKSVLKQFNSDNGIYLRECSRQSANKNFIIDWTDENRKIQSERMKKFYTTDNGKIVKEKASLRMKNRIVSEETKKKLSKRAKERNFGGHTSKRKLYFKKNNGDVIYLQSGYEIKLAQILECNNIEWSRPAPFIWVDVNGEDHRYYPDFKINDIFIDTKNDYLIKKDAEKIRRVKKQNNIKLYVLSEKEINIEKIKELQGKLIPMVE